MDENSSLLVEEGMDVPNAYLSDVLEIFSNGSKRPGDEYIPDEAVALITYGGPNIRLYSDGEGGLKVEVAWGAEVATRSAGFPALSYALWEYATQF
jgi:hypothetical protein